MTMQVDKARLGQITWQNVMPTEVQSIVTELLELRSLSSTEGKEGAKTVAYLIDCPVEPCLEFADVHVPDAAIPLVRRSDLEAAEASHKAARENFLTMQGSAAQLLARAEAAEAHAAKLREALEFYAEPSNYKGAFVQGGYTDHGTFAVSHHVNLVRKDAGALARAALTRSPE